MKSKTEKDIGMADEESIFKVYLVVIMLGWGAICFMVGVAFVKLGLIL